MNRLDIRPQEARPSRPRRPLGLTFAALALAAAACSDPAPTTTQSRTTPRTRSSAPAAFDRAILGAFKPLPASYEDPKRPLTDAKIDLGRKLYYDPRLSKNQDVSCNTCHDLDKYGVDGLALSKGHRGQLGTRNAPSVYDAAGHFVQFWDGRAPDVEEQSKGPVTNPLEMAAPDGAFVEKVLRSIPGYVELFKKAWPDDAEPVTFQHMADAIGAFERKLVTPGRWDAFLGGKDDALTAEEKQGLAKFAEVGCTACHSGALLGGHMYQKVGAVKPYADTKDVGRYEITKQEVDRFVFKVPSLRNVDKTAPYFHDGQVPDLATAVKLMGELQLGRTLNDVEVSSIVTFLHALTGDVPKDYVQKPELPPSGKDTPPPDPK